MEFTQFHSLFSVMLRNITEILRPDTFSDSFDVWDEHVLPGALLSDEACPKGDGVCILAMIDDAVPLLHPRLTAATEDGRVVSRIASAWLMGAGHDARIGRQAPTGREIYGTDIDALLETDAPGCGLDEERIMRGGGLWDARRGPLHVGGRPHGHGAAVIDLLTGMDPRDPKALKRPVIAVGLPPEITRDTEGTFSPWFLYTAMLFILRRAAWIDAKMRSHGHTGPPPPLVVNISYGVTAGSKDGYDMVARFLERLSKRGAIPEDEELGEARTSVGEVRVVLPMGNHRLGRLRARLRPGRSVFLQVPPGDGSPNFVEIWGAPGIPAEPLEFAITPPGGPEMAIPRGDTRGWIKEPPTPPEGPPAFRIYKSVQQASEEPVGGPTREVVTLALPPTEPHGDGMVDGTGTPGLWRIRSTGSGDIDVHVQRDDVVPGYGDPRLQSRLWSPGYEVRGPDGRPIEEDRDDDETIRRGGTVNTFAAVRSDRLVRAAGRLDRPAGRIAPYSGLADAHTAPSDREAWGDGAAVADMSASLRGICARGHAAGAVGRASGTSLAAPQIARAIADALAAGRPITDDVLNPPAPVHALDDRATEPPLGSKVQ